MRALFALFQRSLREDIRARLPPILRGALIIVILLIVWANNRDFARHPAPGREFLGMVLFANLGLLVIATLGIFSSVITEEKEDQTLTLLRMTNLSPLAILFGKSTTRLIGALLLLAVQLPFTLLAVTLGGVSRGQVLAAYAVLGATTFLLCNLALVCSVVARNNMRAGLWTGGIGALMLAALPIICIVTSLQKMPFGALTPHTPWEHFGTWLVESNPAYTLAVLLFEPSKNAPIARHLLVNVVAGVLCFVLAWLLFDRFCTSAGEIVGDRKKRKGRSLGNWGARSRPSIPRSLAWKDFHFLVGGRRGLLIRFMSCALIFLTGYSFIRWVEDTDPHQPYFWRNIGAWTMLAAIVGFGLDCCLTASRMFGEERRNLTLGSLAILPRSTGWLIRQKILGCMPMLLPTIALFGIGVWLRFGFWFDSFGNLRTLLARDRMELGYTLSQALLLPVLVANLSLRIRRGAMPAGIAMVTALNVLTAVVVSLPTAFSTPDKFFVSAAISVGLAIFLAFDIHRKIPTAAAAE